METPQQSNFLTNVLNAGQQTNNALNSLFQGTRVFRAEPEPETMPEPEPAPAATAPTLFATEPEERSQPLTDAELKSMARRKARTWGALLNVLFFLVEVFNSWGMVRKDDERLIEDREKSANLYDLENDLEYKAAKKRVTDFEQFLEEAQTNSQLDEMELEMLEDAFLAEIRAKNKRGELEGEGVTTIIAGLFISRLFKKAGSFSKSFWKKIAVR